MFASLKSISGSGTVWSSAAGRNGSQVMLSEKKNGFVPFARVTLRSALKTTGQ